MKDFRNPMEYISFRLMVTGTTQVVRDGSLNMSLIELIEQCLEKSTTTEDFWREWRDMITPLEGIASILVGLRDRGPEAEDAISTLLEVLRNPDVERPFELKELPALTTS